MRKSSEAGRKGFGGINVGRSSIGRPISLRATPRGVPATHAFAPKLKKNWSKAKQIMKAGLLRVWNFPARMATKAPIGLRELRQKVVTGSRKNASIRNPKNWIGLRPMYSIVRTVA